MPAAVRCTLDADALDPLDPLDPPPVVARGLGVSTQTLANWRCTGRVDLEYIKINRMVRYQRSKWKALAAKGTP